MKILKVLLKTVGMAVIIMNCGALLLLGRSAFGTKALIIPTASMRPTIPPGSLVITHQVPINTLKVGDVITYIDPANPKITISHRIVKKILVAGKIPGFITKGDANKYDDIPIVAGSVEGRVIWHAPHIGGWLLRLKEPIVILPIVYLAGLLVSIDEIKRLSTYYKKFQPYRAAAFRSRYVVEKTSMLGKKLSLGTAATTLFVIVGIAIGPQALALQQSNTVSLTGVSLTTSSSTPPGSSYTKFTCYCGQGEHSNQVRGWSKWCKHDGKQCVCVQKGRDRWQCKLVYEDTHHHH